MSNKPHFDTMDLPNGITPELLKEWYMAYQPIGSGPISTMRTVCVLIEALAEIKGVSLPPAKGIYTSKKKIKASAMSPVERQVRSLVGEQLGVDCFKIGLNVSFEDHDSTFDSLDQVEICMVLEDEFAIDISEEEASTLVNLANCISLVERKSRVF